MEAAGKNFLAEGSPYETALAEAVADRERVVVEINQKKQVIADLEVRKEQLSRLIANLAMLVPEERRQAMIGEPGSQKSEVSSRSGPVFNNVVHLFERSSQRSWTVADIQISLIQDGVPAEVKQVYNTLSYLEKMGKLKRVSRGHYIYLGAGIVTSDTTTSIPHPHHGESDE